MAKNTQALEAFAREELEDVGIQTSDTSFEWLQNTVTLPEGEAGADTPRSVDITRENNGSFSAKRKSIYNLLELDFSDWFELALTAGGIAAVPLQERYKFALAIGALINKMLKKSVKQLNKADAKTLVAMHTFGRRPFTAEQLSEAYLAELKEPLDEEQRERTLKSFKKHNLLRYSVKEGAYILREHVEVRDA